MTEKRQFVCWGCGEKTLEHPYQKCPDCEHDNLPEDEPFWGPSGFDEND